MNNYCIRNKSGRALSQYVPNDLTGNSQLIYRKNDIYSFSGIEEAEGFINHIQTSGTIKTKRASMKLRVSNIR